jgi:acyl carrier protein
MLTKSDMAALVYEQIGDLLDESGTAATEIGENDRLVDLGLTSLLLARLVIGLETEAGVDPFAEDLSVADVPTVGQLIDAYIGAIVKAEVAV